MTDEFFGVIEYGSNIPLDTVRAGASPAPTRNDFNYPEKYFGLMSNVLVLYGQGLPLPWSIWMTDEFFLHCRIWFKHTLDTVRAGASPAPTRNDFDYPENYFGSNISCIGVVGAGLAPALVDLDD